MKILFSTYPHAYQTRGGGEMQLEQYYKYLKKEKKIIVRKFNQWDSSDQIKNYDIIHYFSVMPGSAIGFISYAKYLNKKIIISPNTWITKNDNHPNFDEIKTVLNLSDIIIVNSTLEKNELSNTFCIEEKKFKVIYNFVDDIYLTQKKNNFLNFEKNFKNNRYILNVANIERRKNLLNFLIALNELKISIKVINIGHIREPDYAEKCFSIYKNFKNLDFNSNQEYLKSAYKNCIFFAMPSICETPSIAALEAAACGSKILITAEGSTKEYFKDLVEYINPMDVNSIKEKILKILNYTKPNNALQLETIHKFNSRSQISKLLNIYECI